MSDKADQKLRQKRIREKNRRLRELAKHLSTAIWPINCTSPSEKPANPLSGFQTRQMKRDALTEQWFGTGFSFRLKFIGVHSPLMWLWRKPGSTPRRIADQFGQSKTISPTLLRMWSRPHCRPDRRFWTRSEVLE